MIQSVRHRIPQTIPVGAGLADLVLEDNLSVQQVIQPKILFVNTHPTVDVELTITRYTDLGVSSDPEDDGSFSTEVVSAQTVTAANGQFIYEPDLNLHQDTTAPLVQHKVSISHADPAETPIVQIFVSGFTDVVTREKILNFTRQG